MKKLQRLTAAVLSVLLVCCIFTSCGKQATTTQTDTETELNTADAKITTVNIEEPDLTNAVKIAFSGTSAAVTGTGAKASGGTVTITAGGTYAVSGTVTNGRIIVDADDQDVTIALNGASITCADSSAIYVYKAKNATVYMMSGTENTLADGKTYAYKDGYSSADEEEPNACLYSKADLTLAGAGTLNVKANANNGITSKDALTIDSAMITVSAANHGINGKDVCSINNAVITVTAGGDGVRSTNDTDTKLGYVAVKDSTLTITAGEDGIQAETTVTIDSTTAKIKAGGGYAQKLSDDASAKGIKSGGTLTINGGTFAVNSADDAIHSNKNAVITGGTLTIYTGDDGIHANENLKISGGTVTVKNSYEGLEGKTIDITGGKITIKASDDGINAGGGADQSGFGGMGRDNFGTSADAYLKISGGTLSINADGDGLDSNGTMEISGGTIYVSGPTNNGNGALDYGTSARITGGTLVAAGSSGMAENFGSDSTQGSILLNYSNASTEKITVTDADGKTLIEYTPEKQYNSVIVSCPAMTKGGTYKVTACGETQSVTLDSLIYGSGTGMGNPGGGQMGGFGGGQMGNSGEIPGGSNLPNNGERPNRSNMPNERNSGDSQNSESESGSENSRDGQSRQRPGSRSGDNAESGANSGGTAAGSSLMQEDTQTASYSI